MAFDYIKKYTLVLILGFLPVTRTARENKINLRHKHEKSSKLVGASVLRAFYTGCTFSGSFSLSRVQNCTGE